MKHFTRLSIVIILLLSSGFMALQAQQALPATGGKAKGTGGVVTFTVGQISQETLSGDGKVIFQGVQIPFEIYVVTGKKEHPGITLSCTVYPNPVVDHLILRIDEPQSGKYTVSLFNTNGELISNRKTDVGSTSIPMVNLRPGIYFLKVSDDKKTLKTFKIIKK